MTGSRGGAVAASFSPCALGQYLPASPLMGSAVPAGFCCPQCGKHAAAGCLLEVHPTCGHARSPT